MKPRYTYVSLLPHNFGGVILLVTFLIVLTCVGGPDALGFVLSASIWYLYIVLGIGFALGAIAAIMGVGCAILWVVLFVLRLWQRVADRSLDQLDRERAKAPDSRS